MIVDIFGKNRLRRLGFNIPVGHITAWQAVMLNKAAEELSSESDITRADDIEFARNCRNDKKRSHTELNSRKQVIAFQDRVITINIKEAQHPLKREKQVIDKSSIMLKISTKSMHRVLV